MNYLTPFTEMPFTAHEVELETRYDVSSKAYGTLMCGWPRSLDEEHGPYFVPCYELSAGQG